MNSKELKTKTLHYYRFRKQFKFISTEAGRWESDVLVSNGKEIIEIETKATVADFKNDFKKKKHEVYNKPTTYHLANTVPSKFFFCVPQDMVSDVLPLLENTPYGLLSCLEGKITKRGVFIQIIKDSKVFNQKTAKKLLHKLILRMGSELIRMRIKYLV